MEDGQMQKWLDKEMTNQSSIEQWPLGGLTSVLGENDVTCIGRDGAIHPCAHWLYFVPSVHRSEVDMDGHPKRGKFTPPLPHARRMWAKSVITYSRPLRVGDKVEKKSIISNLEKKSGKSGSLVFLDVKHIYSVQNTVAREELQTLVYRDHQDYDDDIFRSKVEQTPSWSQAMQLGHVDLFRYSAITFNGHRIHYDSDYTRNVEKYPGIIVQGQLIATLVMSKALTSESIAACNRYTFKAIKPLFLDRQFFI